MGIIIKYKTIKTISRKKNNENFSYIILNIRFDDFLLK